MSTPTTEAELRAEAQRCRDAEQASFDRSDTDGCVSQFCHSLSAQLYDTRADIARDGGRAVFTGLYQGERRVKARRVDTRYGHAWLLHEDETELRQRRGKQFLPVGPKSRVLSALGLEERSEWAPAAACHEGSGRGFSGLTSVYVKTFRTGDVWGQDAEQIREGSADQ